MYESSKDTLHVSILYSRKAGIYCAMKDYNASMVFTQKAIEMDSVIGNKRALGIAYLQAAQNQYYLHDIDRSYSFLQKSIAIIEDIGSFTH